MTLTSLREKYLPEKAKALHHLRALVSDQQEVVSFLQGNKKTTPLKVGVLFSGGPAAGGHNVVAALFDAIKEYSEESVLVGFLGGPSGAIENKFIILDAKKIAPYRNQGGFDLLGTGRTKIETEDQFKAVFETCLKHDLDGLVIIGGDDSNTNAAFLSDYFIKNGLKTSVVGIPKTIDGDLQNKWIEASFGFDSAAKTYGELVGNILKDALSQKKYYFFIKVMGRTASHLVLETALNTHPNLAIISEEVKEKGLSLETLIKEIADLIEERALLKKNYGVILIPEGIVEVLPLEAQKKLTLDLDPHGNLPVSKIESERLFIDLVEKELKSRASYQGSFNPQPLFFGYEGRCCFPTNFDAIYCYNLGRLAAVMIANKLTGYMATFKNLSKPPKEWIPFAVPLKLMMDKEMRKGELKLVIKKGLVDLNGNKFKEFAKMRKSWRLDDDYLTPGPIQF